MPAIRRRLTYANVTATLALFLALGGTTVWAARKIHSRQIARGAVKTRNIAKRAVTGPKVAPNAVDSSKLAAGAVDSSEIAAGSITGAKIASNAIDGSKVVDGSLGRTDLAGGALPGILVADQSAGPVASISNGGTTVLPGFTFTPEAGRAYLVTLEARATLAAVGANPCGGSIVVANQQDQSVAAAQFFSTGSTPNTVTSSGVGTVGETQIGIPQTLSATAFAGADCSAASVDAVRVSVVRLG